jgi:hypothetical protein
MSARRGETDQRFMTVTPAIDLGGVTARS